MPHVSQTVPAGSTKDPLLDTAQPSSHLGGTLVKTPEKQRNEGKKVRNSSMNPKVRKEGGGGGALGRYSPAAHGEDHAGADNHTMAWGEAYTRAAGYFLKELQLMKSPHRSRGKV